MDNQDGVMMQGWLYLIRSNTIGFKYSQKLYYILQNRCFKSFRSIPHSYDKDPVRSAVVDSSIHVIDNGRKCIRGKVLFVFTLCDTSNNDAHLKLGASSPEQAAGWIKSFQELSHKMKWMPNYSGKDCDKNDVDEIVSLASIMDHITNDINGPSHWTIFGCHNGLRLFKQARDKVHNKKDSHPALAAVSVIEETPEVIFQTLMSLGSSRSQWDFCFHKGSVIETIDGHTDIVHKQLNRDWLPWSMKRRDFVLQRYWRKDENGAYVILYQSVIHKKCPPQRNFTRARIKCGGYVISPSNRHKQSIVRHMLAIDWKSWRPYLQKSSAPSLTIRMLERLAALRELFRTNVADCLMPPPDHSNFIKMDDQSDEFFDFSEPLFDEESEDSWDVDNSPEKKHELVCGLTLDTRSIYAAAAAQQTGCAELKKIVWDECVSYNYTITLPEDQTGNLANSWSTPEPSIFQIRGETFLEDHKKITAESTLLQTVAMDWLKSNKREDHLAIRPGNIVQKYAADGRPEFFVIVNFQVPGSTTYNLASYHMTRTPIKDLPLLERFIEGDDTFRNSRFKIIPHVTKGPWILRQTINRPTLIGNMLKINYIRGKNYLEMDIDVGSSATARVVAGKTFSCFRSLIIDTAFVIQANTRDELPEQLFGAFRVSHLDISKAVWANP